MACILECQPENVRPFLGEARRPGCRQAGGGDEVFPISSVHFNVVFTRNPHPGFPNANIVMPVFADIGKINQNRDEFISTGEEWVGTR